MKQYNDVVRYVLENGTRKENRTGVDTISAFNYNYTIDMADGFPLLTTKKISWKNIVIETIWFLTAERTTNFLKKHGCKFWDPWADENGVVSSPYGRFWREFPKYEHIEGDRPWFDQLGMIVDTLKTYPYSRRMVVSSWDPYHALKSKLPPCHCFYVFNVQNTPDGHTLNLHLTQRSCDVALGLPYNIAGYALLLHIMSQVTGIRPGKFSHSIVDAHIYTSKPDGSMSEYDHIPGLKEQINREIRPLPELDLSTTINSINGFDKYLDMTTDDIMADFYIDGYDPHPAINFKVAV